MGTKPDISIIGCGKVGTAIGVLSSNAGYHVVTVASKSDESAKLAAERIGESVRAITPEELVEVGGLVLLTVPDDTITPLCEELARKGAFAPGAVVAHCSGVLSSEVLTPARDRCGCAIGSMHPLQTFPTVEAAVEKLPGAWCFVEGDERAVGVLWELAEQIGAKAVRMDPRGKALYHASAVMGCNYLTALVDAAVSMAGAAGIPAHTALGALEPLVRATIDNVFAMGPEKALTGPIARGDIETVQRHIEAMSSVPDRLQELYRVLGIWTVHLSEKKGTLDPLRVEELQKLLRSRDEKE